MDLAAPRGPARSTVTTTSQEDTTMNSLTLAALILILAAFGMHTLAHIHALAVIGQLIVR